MSELSPTREAAIEAAARKMFDIGNKRTKRNLEWDDDGHDLRSVYLREAAEVIDAYERVRGELSPVNDRCSSEGRSNETAESLELSPLAERAPEAFALLAEFVDDEPCSYAHHGFCQTHRYGIRPCANERARALLSECAPQPETRG